MDRQQTQTIKTGQRVRAGRNPDIIEGVVTWAPPPGGETTYVWLVDDEGKRHRKGLRTLVILEDVSLVGQRVMAGRGATRIEGVVTWVTPPDGKQAKVTPYAVVVDDDGKLWKKALSTIEPCAPSTADAILKIWANDGFPASDSEEAELRAALTEVGL